MLIVLLVKCCYAILGMERHLEINYFLKLSLQNFEVFMKINNRLSSDKLF